MGGLWLPLIAAVAWMTVDCAFPGSEPDDGDVRHLYPPLVVGVGLDSHAHALPYLLGWLENVEYPKKQMRIEFFVAGSEDTTRQMLDWWLDSTQSLFREVKVNRENENWMEATLRNGRIKKASRCLLLSADAVPSRPDFLQETFKETAHLVVTPLFRSIDGSSNVDLDFLSEGLLKRSVVRDELSMAALPLAVNLTAIDASYLTFDAQNIHFYKGSPDPLEVFTNAAKRMNIAMHVDNQFDNGLFVNPELDVEDRRNIFRYQLADRLSDGRPLPIVSKSVRPWIPEPQTWDVDKVYVINLKRRPERLRRMLKIFELIGIDAVVLEATDGQNLSSLPEPYRSYKTLPGYVDPLAKRPIKLGEIGCFISHFRIWEEVAKNGYKRVIVFEDDLRFAANGMRQVREVLQDLDASRRPWDLVYLGRKKQSDVEELWVAEHRHLSTVEYSYWTLGYMLSASGAAKLLAPKPLEKVVPVDEYLPIMVDQLHMDVREYLVNFYRSSLGQIMGCALSRADITGEGLRIKVVKEIAKGGFSQVLRCDDVDSGEEYAVKKINVNSDEEETRVNEEAGIHRLLSGIGNSVPLLAMIGEDSTFYLVFPFFSRGTLADDLASRRGPQRWLDQLQVLTYFVDVCTVVEFLHNHGIAHRDLKTANVLIADDGRGMLTDYGSCGRVPKEIQNARDHQQYLDETAELCSMPYRAPELFTCDIGTVVTNRIDIWSLGCCLYALCFFVSPFDVTYEKGNSIALAAQSPQMIVYPKEAPYNEEVVELIKWMLVAEPESRPPIVSVLERSRQLQKRLRGKPDDVISASNVVFA